MIFEAIQAVLMVVIIIAVGYFVSWKGWAGKTVTNFISNLIVNVTLPCTAVTAFLTSFTAETLADSWIYILASFLAIGITWLIAKLVIKIAKIEKTQRGVFTALFSFSNSVFIGLPVATAIFGDDALIFALFYYVANTTFMNSLGFVEIARDGMELSCGGKGVCFTAKDILKKIFKPPMIAVILGFILVMLGVRLPVFLDSALSYIGGITSPLALMFVGMVLQRTGISCVRKIDRGISWTLVGRYLVSPLVMLGVTACMGLAAFPSEVLTIQMSLPAMVTATIFAEAAGADTEFAARGVAVTTLLSFITIPIYILLFTYL
ncbi:AEC family transporter [Christensenella intestinihominis]|uniref:AEC family transporter n=1 Tax=Christensenella intestinihominis TaxID=1851429 RepID=UPI000832F71E|nr:AEC family transporter [Christensenella intestinihominis]